MASSEVLAFTSSDLQFTAEDHAYRLPDGRRIPSVTQILRAVGVSTDFDELRASSSRLAERIDYRRDLGVAVHADAHAFDDDDLEWDTVDPDVLPFLEAWSVFRENTGLVPITRERRLYHPGLGVCGTLDGIFYRERAPDRRVLVDLKCGDPEAAAARYQTALYQLLWEAEHPNEPIAERWSVQLTPTLAVPYRITAYADWTDLATARAIVTTYFAQAARRRPAHE